MLNQILVLSPDGPCYIYRNYNGSEQKVDPQLISAMVALKSSGNIRLSDIIKILQQESNDPEEYNLEISNTHNYITCAISSTHEDSHKLRDILPKINQMIYEILGSPTSVASIDKKQIEVLEHRTDLIMIKEGLTNNEVHKV